MILGIGMDLCQIARMEKAIERPGFVERFYPPAEVERMRAASGARRAEIAAGLFAAKEAVAKALGTGFSGCALRRGALERARSLCGGGFSVWVSITHDGGMAAATAVIEGTTRPDATPFKGADAP